MSAAIFGTGAKWHLCVSSLKSGSVISPALFNHFVSDYLIPDLDMMSYANDFVTTPMPLPHLWWRAAGGRLPLIQTPPTRPDDRGDRPVRSQAPNKGFMASPSNWPSQTTAAPDLPKRPLLAPIRLLFEAPVLPLFCRLADDPTSPDCHSTDHTVAHLFS